MKKSNILVIVFATLLMLTFTACKKETSKPAEEVPEQIYFDVLGVDNGEISTTQSQVVTVRVNP